MTLRDRIPTRDTSRARLAEFDTHLARQRVEVLQVRKKMQDLRARLDRFRSRLDGLSERLDTVHQHVKQLRVGYGRVDGQMSAFECRLASLESLDQERREPPEGPSESGSASRVLEEIRQEHSRVRARFQVMTTYEERIRRLEEALAPTSDQG